MKIVKESLTSNENVLYLNLEKNPPRKGPINLKGKVANKDSVHYGEDVDIEFIFPSLSHYKINGEKVYLGEDEVEYEFKIPSLNTWISYIDEKPFFPKTYPAKYKGQDCWLRIGERSFSISTDRGGLNSLLKDVRVGDKIALDELFYMYTPEFIKELKY